VASINATEQIELPKRVDSVKSMQDRKAEKTVFLAEDGTKMLEKNGLRLLLTTGE